jgi:hypothetical protein
MRTRQRQRGLSIVGFIFVAIVAMVVVMVGFRMVPAYIEGVYGQEGHGRHAADVRDGFSSSVQRLTKAAADYIDSVRGSDVEVTKEGNQLVATANWQKVLHLVGNVSLLLEFEATATK